MGGRKKRGRPIKILIAMLIPAIAIMTGLTLNRYFVIEERLNYSVSENVVWGAAQAEVELSLFLYALTDATQDDSPERRARLQQRFDILWSRVGLYQAGTLRRSLNANPGLRDQVDALALDLRLIDDTIKRGPTPEDFQMIRATMRRHIEPLQQLTNFALTKDRVERQGIQKTQEDARRELAVLMSLLLITVAGAGAHLFFSERRAQKHLGTVIRSRREAADAWMRLKEAVEAISEGFVLYDAEDRLVLCNTTYKQIYARSSEAILTGARFEDLLRFGIERGQYRGVGSDPEGWIKEMLARRREGTEPFEQELGDGRWLIVSDRRTGDGGLVGIRTDITDLKRNVAQLTQAHQSLADQAERMRKLAEAAEDANRAKTGFMAMISHEIRTPMNAVLGLAGLLGETRLDATQKRYIAGINDSGTHLLALINDILDFARLESGKDEARPVPTEFRELVDGIAKMITVLAMEKGLRFSVSIGAEVPHHLVLDPAYLRQVLINILGNAVKFTQTGGVHLDVTATHEAPDRVRLRLAVNDTGVGIPAAMQLRMFDPFERGTSSGTMGGGTGLGLAISRRLVCAMDGSLHLARSDTSGTEFIVEIPAQTCMPTSSSMAAIGTGQTDKDVDHARAIPRLAILVAEDTPASQLVIRTMLENRGHQVTLVSDGQSALAAATNADFDLIILDIQMPVMFGDEVVAAIRKLGGKRGSVMIAALTAQAFEEDRRHAIDAGFDHHLSKPVRQAELAKLLEQAAQRLVQDGEGGATHAPAETGEDLLAELEAVCDTATFAMLLNAATENISHERDEILNAETEGDHASISRSAHRLVALLGQYGGRSAIEAAAAVENATSAALAERLPALHDEIRRTLGDLRRRQTV
jgi:signal transduction histidine kinase/CheY-like chemotaxis protein